MTTNRSFLRISDQWTEVLEPGDRNTYVANLSGDTIKMYLSDTRINPNTINNETFTIGGCIRQVRIIKDKYVYFKASIDPGTTTVVLKDYEYISSEEIDILKNELTAMALQLIDLTKRVTRNEIKLIKNKINLKLLARNWLHNIASTNVYLSDVTNAIVDIFGRLYAAEATMAGLREKHDYLEHVSFHELYEIISKNFNNTDKHLLAIDKNILSLWKKLYKAEDFVVTHQYNYTILKTAVDNLIANLGDDAPQSVILNKLSLITSRLENIEVGLANVNNEITRLQQGEGIDTSSLQTQLSKLNTDFAALNNAIVQLSYSYTPSDIEDVFNLILPSIPDSMINSITAIKDDLVRLSETQEIKDAIADGTIVTTNNNYILGDLNATTLNNSGN